MTSPVTCLGTSRGSLTCGQTFATRRTRLAHQLQCVLVSSFQSSSLRRPTCPLSTVPESYLLSSFGTLSQGTAALPVPPAPGTDQAPFPRVMSREKRKQPCHSFLPSAPWLAGGTRQPFLRADVTRKQHRWTRHRGAVVGFSALSPGADFVFDLFPDGALSCLLARPSGGHLGRTGREGGQARAAGCARDPTFHVRCLPSSPRAAGSAAPPPQPACLRSPSAFPGWAID